MASPLEISLKKARKALQSENFRVAATHYRRLAKLHSGHPVILLEAVRALTHVGDLALARQLLKQAEVLAKQSPDFISPVASGYFKMGDYEKAHQVLRKSWDESPSSGIGMALAEVCERMGNLTEGMQVLTKLPDPPVRAELLKGLMLMRQGDYDSARVSLEAVESGKKGKTDGDTQMRISLSLATCLEKQGFYHEAWTTMENARTKAYPSAKVAQMLDAKWQSDIDLSNSIYDHYDFSPRVDNFCKEPPVLVAGHPRSGTSVVAIHLAKKLQRFDLDEIGSFMRLLEAGRYLGKDPARLKQRDCLKLRQQYTEQMQLFAPGLTNNQPLLDKNPGMELWAPYWLSVFPDTRIYLVQRHPLDCLLSCMFTYLPLNHFSLQFYTAERAARSIRASMSIQERLSKLASDSVEIIQYEDFVASHTGRQSETSQISGVGSMHSANYALAREKVNTQRVKRYENYLEFLPRSVIRDLAH